MDEIVLTVLAIAMPLFMDRHDVSNTVTAEIVAQLHQQDLKIQHRFGCRGITYWFDGVRKTAFCLVEAPDAKAIKDMHASAHGNVPNQIIEVAPDLVESFLGRIEDPKAPETSKFTIIDEPAFRYIMVIRFLRNLKNDRRREDTRIRNAGKTVMALFQDAKAGIVKQHPEYFLISFKSATAAIQTAVRVCEISHQQSEEFTDGFPDIRIGISAGAPFRRNESMFESATNCAEMLCSLGRAAVVVSAEVRASYNDENALTLDPQAVDSLSARDENFMMQLMEFMRAAYGNAYLSVSDVTKALGLSKSSLYRSIVALTGMSLNAFIGAYRLNIALGLLRKHDANISEVAYETGFTSPSYFSKCFQKRFGVSPSTLKNFQ